MKRAPGRSPWRGCVKGGEWLPAPHVPFRFRVGPAESGVSRRSNRWAPMTRIAVCALASLCLSAGDSGSQPSSGPIGPPDSYQYLSTDAATLIDRYLVSKGLPRGPGGYETLSESQRTTFESITHALESQGDLGIVADVTEIWGEMQGAGGEDQFRLSVVLTSDAVDELLSRRDYKGKSMFGHVKLPSGMVVGLFGADSVRQEGRRPALHISWLEDDWTVGEIDIDYRENGEGHTQSSNSDIRARTDGGETHHERHVERFGAIHAWWRP